MNWSRVVNFCDVCVGCLESHSGGAHSLQRSHWKAMPCRIFSRSFGWGDGLICILDGLRLSDALDFPQQNNQQAGGPVWPGQPANPTWPGQPANPTWPAQPNQPAWPGQPGQPTAPGWPGPAPQTGPYAAPGQAPRALTVPFDLPLQSGAYNKMLITIVGEVKPNAKHFTVNLNKGNDIVFHLNPRFNEGGRQVIVRNSMIGNQWGREERELPSFPFVPGKPFELKILCTDTEFRVAVNKAHLLEFKHRTRELNQIRALSIFNDVTLNSVNVETLQ